jgi:general secretion pathway protein G
MRRNAGFTLIEVLVVMVILAILATVVVPRMMDAPDKARITKAQQDIAGLAAAMQMYRVDNGTYPSTDQNLEALIGKPVGDPPAPNWKTGGYVQRLPRDPWDRPYQYLSPGQRGEFDLYSLGADGKIGGEGMDADIGNWGP